MGSYGKAEKSCNLAFNAGFSLAQEKKHGTISTKRNPLEDSMTIHEQLSQQYEIYLAENTKFTEKGVKVSAARARKALAEIAKLCKERRKEIQEAKEQ